MAVTVNNPDSRHSSRARAFQYIVFLQPACFFRQKAWEIGGPLREDLYICLDVDLWLRMEERGVKFEKLDARLAQAKVHQDAKTSVELECMRAETALLIQEYGGIETARRMIASLDEDLTEAREQLNRLKNDRAFKVLKWVKDTAKMIAGRA